MRYRGRMKDIGLIWRVGLILMVLALIERAALIPGKTFSPRWIEASSGFMIGLALVLLIQRFRSKKHAEAGRQAPAS